MGNKSNKCKQKKTLLSSKITLIMGIGYVSIIIIFLLLVYLGYKQTNDVLIYYICLLGLTVIIWLLIDQYIYKNITSPITTLTECVKNYKYSSDEDKLIMLNKLEELEGTITNNNYELKFLYYTLTDMLKHNFYYIEHLKQLQCDMTNIKERAYKDSLTGVGSKMSYIIELDAIKKEISREKINIAIVMADVNNLKYVNDNCGHDKGNLYLIGCCKILTETFKNSLIYRVGGDEFIIIVKGKDYEYLSTLYNECTDTYEKTFKQDKVPWEKYSASLGIAILNQELPTIEAVEKAADESMYANKMEFRKQYGSYR